jgi:hypothetical protein
MNRVLSRLPAVLVVLSAALAGCGSEAARRDAEYATFRASMHEQRAAAYAAYAEQLRAVVALQQVMLAQDLARPPAAAPADPAPPPRSEAPRPVAHGGASPGPLPLLDAVGAPVPGSSYGPVGDIVARVEAYLGRSLSGPERTALGQILRRPRPMDRTDPWPVLQ